MNKKYEATISGKVAYTSEDPFVSSWELIEYLARATLLNAKKHGDYYIDDGGYWLPRQNRPNGETGDGNYRFDLRECNDFMLVHITEKERDNNYEKLNLYGEEERKIKYKAWRDSLPKIKTVRDLINELSKCDMESSVVISSNNLTYMKGVDRIENKGQVFIIEK